MAKTPFFIAFFTQTAKPLRNIEVYVSFSPDSLVIHDPSITITETLHRSRITLQFFHSSVTTRAPEIAWNWNDLAASAHLLSN